MRHDKRRRQDDDDHERDPPMMDWSKVSRLVLARQAELAARRELADVLAQIGRLQTTMTTEERERAMKMLKREEKIG